MEKRYLGKSRLEVSTIGLGCMGMTGIYGPVNDAESIATIHLALSVGITLFDTSDMYGWGQNEELLGKALQGRRAAAIIATKFGNIRGKDGGHGGVNGRPEYVKQACEACLKRLGVDYIDLLYVHRVDPQTPIEDTVGALSELVKEGKVRCIGLSEVSPKTLRRAHAVHPITALQTEYSLWTRDVEAEVLPTCRELGISFVAYAPLGRGFLTGQVRQIDELAPGDMRRGSPRFQGENFEKNRAAVSILEKVAAENGCTVSQLALAWVLAQGSDVVPIPGTRKRDHLRENIRALEISLAPESLRRLDGIAGNIVGSRYPEAAMRRLNL